MTVTSESNEYLKQAETAVSNCRPNSPVECPAAELIYMHHVTEHYAPGAGLSAIARRDKCLREAAGELSSEFDNTNKRSIEMARIIGLFLDNVNLWPKYQNHALPPDGWSDLLKCLFMACQSGVFLPRGTSKIGEILEASSRLEGLRD